MESKQTCLVSGGAGFIGSHLCMRLISSGYKVFCLDNLITGSKKNIDSLSAHPHFVFISHDVTKPIPIVGKIEYVFHLASPASVIDYQKYPVETALVNSVGTVNMLDLSRAYGAKFLFTSTSEVYGDPKEHPQKETYWGNVNPIGVRACYDESKRFGEMITTTYTRLYGVDARIVRIFNTYGPHMRPDDGRVISNFINQALEGKEITVYGRGTQTRSFCFVSDLVEGLVAMMFSDKTKGEVVNLGNPEEYTMLELAKKIALMTKTKARIVHKPLPSDDPEKRKPTIDKATSLFGWRPTVSLSDGLKQTIAYYNAL